MTTATKKKTRKKASTNGNGNGNGNGSPGLIKWTGRVAADKSVVIQAPNMQRVEFHIRGDSGYVQNKFSNRSVAEIRAKHAAGSTVRSKKKAPKDFDALFEAAMHRSEEGWYGIPCGGLRSALVSACKIVKFHMSKGKLGIFVEADGFDYEDGTPLFKITKGEPRKIESMVRIQQTTDLRVRALWEAGWEAMPRMRFDADMFSLQDVCNLLMRVGMQVGLGEGRHDSRTSTGVGWGTFEVL